MVLLCITRMVRSSMHLWSPFLKYGIKQLERKQRRKPKPWQVFLFYRNWLSVCLGQAKQRGTQLICTSLYGIHSHKTHWRSLSLMALKGDLFMEDMPITSNRPDDNMTSAYRMPLNMDCRETPAQESSLPSSYSWTTSHFTSTQK